MQSPHRVPATVASALTTAALVTLCVLTGTPRILAAAALVATVAVWSRRAASPTPLIPAWALVGYVVVEQQASPAHDGTMGRNELLVAGALTLAWAISAAGSTRRQRTAHVHQVVDGVVHEVAGERVDGEHRTVTA